MHCVPFNWDYRSKTYRSVLVVAAVDFVVAAVDVVVAAVDVVVVFLAFEVLSCVAQADKIVHLLG